MDELRGLFANLPFGIGDNWLLVLVCIVAAVLYFLLGRSGLPLSDLLGGFLK